MAIFDLYSKRQKRLRGEVSDIYKYDNFPQTLKVQIVHIICDAFGPNDYQGRCMRAYEFIYGTLCREYGVFALTNVLNESKEQQVLNFLLNATTTSEEAIDVIELTFKYLEENHQKGYKFNMTSVISPEDAISELNVRFKENGIGYSFDGNQIIRVDSTYIHTEITKPTISLLWKKKFKGANEEYLKAHEHYRNGRNKECLIECLKAFESTMKIICKEKGWAFNQADNASKLIQICFQNELLPTFMQTQYNSLQSLLASGVPTIRNKQGAHGQGQTPQIVEDEMTRYGLNLTGTNIIFLIELSGL